jgi:hypothetical protein
MGDYSVVGKEQLQRVFNVGNALFIATTTKIFIFMNNVTKVFYFFNPMISDLFVDLDSIQVLYTTAANTDDDDRYYIAYTLFSTSNNSISMAFTSVMCALIDDSTIDISIDPDIESRGPRVSIYDNTLMAIDSLANVYNYNPEKREIWRVIVSSDPTILVTSHTIQKLNSISYLIWSDRRSINYINLSSIIGNTAIVEALKYNDVVINIPDILELDNGDNPSYVGAYVTTVDQDLYAWFGYGSSANSSLKYKVYMLPATSQITGTWSDVGNTINLGSIEVPDNINSVFSIKTLFKVNGRLFVLGNNSRLLALINNIWEVVTLNGNATSDTAALVNNYLCNNDYIVHNNILYMTVKTMRGNGEIRSDVVYYNSVTNKLKFIRYSNSIDYETCGKYLVGSTLYLAVGNNNNPTSTPNSNIGLYKLNPNNTLDETKNYAVNYSLKEGTFYDGNIYANALVYPSTDSGIISVPLISNDSVVSVLNSDNITNDQKRIVFKTFLQSSSSVSTVVLNNIDATSLFTGSDITQEVIAKYKNVKITGIAAPDLDDANNRVVEMTKGELSNLFVIPFNLGHFTLRVTDDADYDIRFDINTIPYLTINNVGIAIGDTATIAGINMLFLTRGSIWLAPLPITNNTYPVRMKDFLAINRTILFTSDTITAAKTGRTLPLNQGAYVGVAGDCFRDLGAQVNLYTSNNKILYIFRRAQLIKGATTEGIGGSAGDAYMTGYLCVWSASGVPPNSL